MLHLNSKFWRICSSKMTESSIHWIDTGLHDIQFSVSILSWTYRWAMHLGLWDYKRTVIPPS